ncbi:DUF2637 domain-containing protein [Kineococcus sp. SYSU DK003]|uniref:DUF2637 domain-containing protein n=1 Tax=Kineococcus sp. SYSU DK003 TaxID=3383124 RepID=UPI003D7CB799
MTATTDRWSARPDALSATSNVDTLAERAAAVGVAVLIITGFIASYTTLRDLATTVGQFPTWLAPVVPLSFDVGIVVLSLKVLMAARAGHRSLGLRTLVLTLSVATVVANGASADHLTGRLLHAVPSAMFVICFETVVSSARRAALATADGQPTPGPFRPARWLLAPRATWNRWRVHVLTDHQPPSLVHQATQPLAAMAAFIRPTTAAGLPSVEENSSDDQSVTGASVASAPRAPNEGSTSRSASSSKALRLQAARTILRNQPDITSAALAEALTAVGHPVSLRTAHRVRDEVRAAAQGDDA